MTEIEAKRKELDKPSTRRSLIFFNLGVEMARKEFLKFLKSIYPNLPLEGSVRIKVKYYMQSLSNNGKQMIDKQFNCLVCGKLVYPMEIHTYNDCLEYKNRNKGATSK